MSNLVLSLCKGLHPVEISLRPIKTAQALKERIDRYSFVHVRFTETRGGTEVGFPIDREESQLDAADFASAVGTVRLSGRLVLDDVPVRCVAEIDLSTLAGTGALHLIPTPASQL
jgi:hypothetical protein